MYLVRGGVSKTTILLKSDGSETAEFAAAELRRYVRKISGAAIRIVSEENKVAGKAVVLEVRNTARLSREGFVIRSEPDSVSVTSPSGRGLLYGVYALLEHMGCRWCSPGDDAIPGKKNIRLESFRLREQPGFPYRALADPGGERKNLVESFKAGIDWAAKLRLNNVCLYFAWDGICVDGHERIPVSMDDYKRELLPEIRKRGLGINTGGHSFFLWLPPDRYFKSHPEYFSMVDGKRQPAQICVTNREAINTVAGRIKDFLKRYPEVEVIDLSPMDGQKWCRCENCRKMDLGLKKIGGGGLFGKEPKSTRSYLNFVNEVAGRVRPGYPNVRFFATAYVQYIDPPERLKAEDNVWIDLYWYWRCYAHEIDDSRCPRNRFYMKMLSGWMKFANKRVNIPEYHYGMKAWFGNPWPILTKMVHDWPVMRALGIEGGQSKPDSTPSYVLNTYVFSRLLWAGKLHGGLDRIMSDYCSSYYGAAGRAVCGYYKCLEKSVGGMNGHLEPDMKAFLTKLLSPREIRRLNELARRIGKCGAKGDFRRRVAEFLKMHKHTALCWSVLSQMEEAVRKEAGGDVKGSKQAYRKVIRDAERSLKHYPTRGILRELRNAQRGLGLEVPEFEETLAEAVSRIAKGK